RQNRISRTNQILFKISESLQQYQRLDDLLTSINKEIKKLMAIKAAFVLLLDDNKEEFFFFSALFDGTESEKKFKKIRFPADQGVSGQVYKTGKPLIVHDVSKCSFFLRRVDEETDLDAKNILTVPIQLKDNIIGVLAVVNKVNGPFDDNDIELLCAIASTIALPIENARINEKLRKSYGDLQSINKAKDRVIHHLSHELKTPVSVLAASFKLLSKELEKLGIKTDTIDRILERGKRNLKRLLEIQYEVEDLLKQKKYQAYHILSKMLEVLKDELEILFESELEQKNLVPVIRSKIDELFGHKEFESVQIRLDHFLKQKLASLAPLFRHRQCHIETEFNQPITVNLPREILHFVTEGIIRNAIENTPDLGKIKIKVRPTKKKAELIFTDFGVGITREKKRLLFENYFNAPDTLLYSTKKPYDFNAGGKGFDLLRFKIFSERYLFKIEIKSKRCHFIPADEDICSGNIDQCSHCLDLSNCHKSGGTTIRLIFP
ncbi:MAG: GAF domain-containing sensor histidine kinase, partial [Desulfobacteraceae bacterium]|nr:GAF domain-containing sensor histidine kinase [Desulfobacteraceae bacterium]